MKKYTTDSPAFSTEIDIVETNDLVHADIANVAPIQVFQNTLALAEILTPSAVMSGFRKVFTYLQNDEEAMDSSEIETALDTVWNGESSMDPFAMKSYDVAMSLETEWQGESSEDDEAMKKEEISSIVT